MLFLLPSVLRGPSGLLWGDKPLSPWICDARVFEVRIYNPPHHSGSQTLILRNGGLQIHRDRILDYGDEWMEERKKERQRTRELLGL